jgi:succinyl-diaminopimelate desuccinylase
MPGQACGPFFGADRQACGSANGRTVAGTAAQSNLAAAHAFIAANAHTAVDELALLIAIDTSFPPGAGYEALADRLEQCVARLGFRSERVDVPLQLWTVRNGPAHGKRVNLVARRPTGKPVCGLYFHVDTVPVAPGWQRDPLRLTREGDLLYGLGAADMKGCIAAILLALRAAEHCDVGLAYDPMLLFCTDEEGGLYPGVRYLAEQGMLEGHIVNFNGSAEARIWAGCFGMFNLAVTVRGEAVHAGEGSKLGAGVNAIEGALPLLEALHELKSVVSQRSSALPAPPHASGPLKAQLNISAVHGGASGGQIPAELSILINRRYPREERFEDAVAEIEQLVQRALAGQPSLRADVQVVGHLIPTSDPDGPHWPRWQRAVGIGFGYEAESFRRWGASSCSDFGYVQQATGRSEVLLGGLGRPERNIHGPDEHTTLGDIVSLARSVLAYLAANFAPDLIPEHSQSD